MLKCDICCLPTRLIHYASVQFLSSNIQEAQDVAQWVYAVAMAVKDERPDRAAPFNGSRDQALTMLARIYNGLSPYGLPDSYVPQRSSLSMSSTIRDLLNTHATLEATYLCKYLDPVGILFFLVLQPTPQLELE